MKLEQLKTINEGKSVNDLFDDQLSKNGFFEKNLYIDNQNLTSLAGCPKKVEGIFYCDKNHLTSLKGGPEFVGGDFSCDTNLLESLIGGPKIVNGKVYQCKNNKLKSLEGIAKGEFTQLHASNNKLQNLEFLPQTLEILDVSSNELSSIEGTQGHYSNFFFCHHNKLTSLKGGP